MFMWQLIAIRLNTKIDSKLSSKRERWGKFKAFNMLYKKINKIKASINNKDRLQFLKNILGHNVELLILLEILA